MGFFSWLAGGSSSSYDDGYNAGEEFLDLTEDRYISDDEVCAQWQAVESDHDNDYARGFADSMEKNSGGWLSRLFGG